MIIQVLLLLFVAYLSYFYYSRVYLTKQLMLHYKSVFEKAGFRVKLQPFQLFASSYLNHLYSSEKTHANPVYHFQHELHNYDVVIDCVMNKVLLQLIHVDLNQGYFNSKLTEYKKFEPIIANFKRVMGQGVAFSEGREWTRKRRVISQAFHFQLLNELIPDIAKTADEVFSQFEKEHEVEGGVRKMDLLSIMENILASVIVKCFFGSDMQGKKIDGKPLANFVGELAGLAYQQGLKKAALILGADFLKLGVRAIDRQVNRKTKLFNDFAKETMLNKIKHLKSINFKKEDKANRDIIEELYLANGIDQNFADQNTFNFSELIEELSTFFVAGTDTTSHLLTMSIIYLERNPHVKEKVLQEIHSIIKSDSDITADNLKKMEYTMAVFNQTMRIYGPANKIFFREAVIDNQIAGVPISAGTILFTDFCSNNYSPVHHQNPNTFDPERWLKETKMHSFAFTPFSSGQRNCIGQHLAKIEAKTVLIKFVRRYNFKIENPDLIRLVYRFVLSPEKFDTLVKNI